MAEFGNYVIYLIMLGAVLGALASILRPESGLGREFVNGIHAIGPVFLAQAGIMVAIPYLSKAISHALGPFFQTLGSDVSIAALSIIAVDMGGYQLADALTANRDMWITAMLVGYTSGATIVYLIPVGLTMLERKDHKYLALGAMAGLISIPFAVLAALLLITLNHIPVRELVSTGSPALHYLSLDFLDMLRLLAPLFVFCFLLAAGLKYRATAMVTGFLVFGKVMDAFIKMALALSIVQHFTGVFTKVFGGWGFDPMFADEKELFRAIEIAGYIGIMLAGTFPICYLFQRYCKRPMAVLGRYLGLSQPGATAFVMVLANIIAEAASAEFAGDHLGFVLEGHQYVADLVLHEGSGGGAAAGVEHRYLLEQLADEFLGLVLVTAVLQHVAPGGEIGVAAIAGGLGVRHHYLDAVLEQVRPVLQGLGVALANDEHGGRGERRAVVRQAGRPVLRHQAAVVGEGVDVGGLVHGDDVGGQTVDHRARLLAGTAMGHLDGDVLAFLRFPVFLEGRVVFLVEVAHHVVGDVEQGLGGVSGAAERQAGGQQGGAEQSFHRAVPLSML
ncbi:ethanolamine utilization protein EutH [Pseudomonas aeruginosa LESlike7]|nr:ethanolamine utilization protein EutH [Pseudomonas aeruginosa LESlike7]